MLKGAGLMLGGAFKSYGGFMLTLGGISIFYTGIGILGAGAGIFVTSAGASDMNQGAEEFFLGLSGDSTTSTSNGMSDMFYDGNDTIYHLSTGTAAAAGSTLTPYVNGAYENAMVTAGNTETPIQTITNKFPTDNQLGKRFNYRIDEGRIIMEENSIHNMDFVVDSEGNLILGKGHAYLSDGQMVQAAGSLKIDANGYVRGITNWSGHYRPTAIETINYPTILENTGVNLDKAWLRIDEFTVDSATNLISDISNYYNGPVNNIPK